MLSPTRLVKTSRFWLTVAQSAGDVQQKLFGAFPHIYVRSGYILWVARFTPFPPNLIKRSLAPENIRTKPPASLRPKGSLSLTRMLSRFNHSNSQVSSYIHFPNLIINSNEVRTCPRNRNIEICRLDETFL